MCVCLFMYSYDLHTYTCSDMCSPELSFHCIELTDMRVQNGMSCSVFRTTAHTPSPWRIAGPGPSAAKVRVLSALRLPKNSDRS